MRDEKVCNWMSKNLIIVDPDTTLPQAYTLMTKYNIRRLPVLQYGNLVGIVTLGDVREARPFDAQSMSIYKLNFLLSRLQVKQIMTKKPITIPLDASIGMAAKLMYEHKIGGLPVMENNQVVGIITESDIFRLIAQDLDDEGNSVNSPALGQKQVQNPSQTQSNLSKYLQI